MIACEAVAFLIWHERISSVRRGGRVSVDLPRARHAHGERPFLRQPPASRACQSCHTAPVRQDHGSTGSRFDRIPPSAHGFLRWERTISSTVSRRMERRGTEASPAKGYLGPPAEASLVAGR